MWYVASCYGNHRVYSCGVVDVYFNGEYIHDILSGGNMRNPGKIAADDN